MIIDQGELGKESTWAGGGILSPLYPWRYPEPFRVLVQYGQQHYPALCETVREETDIDPQWIRSGLVFTDDTDMQQRKRGQQTWGYDLQHLHIR